MIQHREFVTMDEVPKGEFIDATTNIETTGMALVATDAKQLNRVASALHEVYSKVSEVNIVPPLSEEQAKDYVGKTIMFGALLESADVPKKPKATDTAAIPTDKRKP